MKGERADFAESRGEGAGRRIEWTVRVAAVGRWRGEKWKRDADALANEELKLEVGKVDVGQDAVKIEEPLSPRHSAVAITCARDF